MICLINMSVTMLGLMLEMVQEAETPYTTYIYRVAKCGRVDARTRRDALCVNELYGILPALPGKRSSRITGMFSNLTNLTMSYAELYST